MSKRNRAEKSADPPQECTVFPQPNLPLKITCDVCHRSRFLNPNGRNVGPIGQIFSEADATPRSHCRSHPQKFSTDRSPSGVCGKFQIGTECSCFAAWVGRETARAKYTSIDRRLRRLKSEHLNRGCSTRLVYYLRHDIEFLLCLRLIRSRKLEYPPWIGGNEQSVRLDQQRSRRQ